MQDYPLIEHQTRLQYRLLGHEGYWTQLHAQDVNSNKLISRELVYGEEEVIKWGKEYCSKANLFLGRSPRNKDGSVAGITCVSLDVDPVREPKRAALPEQHQRALKAAGRINKDVGLSGVCCSSGNGALLLLPLESMEPDVEGLTARIKVFEEHLRQQISDQEVRLDATFDAPRLIKLLGSLSVKGDERYWRYARFIDKPTFFRRRSSKVLERIKSIPLPESSVRVDSKLNGTGDRDYSSVSPSERLRLAEACIKRLNPIRCDNYEEWIKVGMALKEFGVAGLALWRNWSQQSSKYRNGDCEAKWRTFGDKPSVTVGTIKYWADQDTPQQRPGTLVQGLPTEGGSAGDRRSLDLWLPGQGFQDYERDLQERGDTSRQRLCTGFAELDSKIWELPRRELSTFAARSGYGKTSFAVTVAEYLRRRGARILFFSTEMGRFRVWDKFCSVAKGITAFGFTSGQLSDRDRSLIREYAAEVKQSPIYLCDDSVPSLAAVRDQVNGLKPDVFFFDHINWIASERTQIRDYFQGLKQIAVSANCAGVVLAQLNEPPRDLQNGGLLDSSRSDIRESKDLITDSAVLALWQNSGLPREHKQKIKLTVAKARYGGSEESIYLQVDKRYGRFESYEEHP